MLQVVSVLEKIFCGLFSKLGCLWHDASFLHFQTLGVRFSPTRSKLNNFISSMLKFVRQNPLGRSQLVLLGTTLREKILNFNLLFINFVTIRGLYYEYEKLISRVCPIKRNYQHSSCSMSTPQADFYFLLSVVLFLNTEFVINLSPAL